MDMTKFLVLAACTVALTSGCAASTGGSSGPPVPAEFATACGHPGAKVEVLSVPVTIRHAACDLTGVELTYGLATIVVPDHGHDERQVETLVATTSPTKITVTVDAKTHDLTVTG